MKKLSNIFRSVLAAIFLFGMVIGVETIAKDKPGDEKNNSLAKTTIYNPDRFQILNINNLWAWASVDGISAWPPSGPNGIWFPRGALYVIYKDGMVFGAKAYLDADHTQPAPFGQTVRVGGTHYSTTTREGWVTGQGATAVPASLDDPDNRMYRIRRDWKEMSDAELRRDAAESNNNVQVSSITASQVEEIKARYEKDWNEWPVDLGAPYIDRNNNGIYDEPPAGFAVADLINNEYDEPGIAGGDPNSPADQVIWAIWNDLNVQAALPNFNSNPVGLEIQLTTWGYKRTDALGNIFFRKWKLINRGGVDTSGDGNPDGVFYLDSMYVCQWSDPDLGNHADDLLGCDTTLSLGYVYNGLAIDDLFLEAQLPPAAVGYDFLAGPIVESPGDRAVVDLKYVDGFRNLGMSGFSYFSAGSPYTDPGGSYETDALLWYKMLRGFAPLTGPDAPYAHPPGVTPGPFPLAGDPVTQTGHIDGQGTEWSFPLGDRRLLVITGPFELAPAEAQEVVVAFVAGLGADRLSSVAVMKFNDRFAQNTYDALFQVPSPPQAPNVVVTELDGEINLEWGSDLARVASTEDKVNEPGSFEFEGYNVYQLPNPTASLSDAVRLATFDKLDDPSVVLDEQFDVGSGQILNIPVQFGSNSGIQRYFKVDEDFVTGIKALFNGTEYYLGVTSYSVAKQPGFLPAQLESEMTVLRVTPKVPFGTSYQTAFGEILDVTHEAGGSFGSVEPIVVDPAASTGASYEVSFVAVDVATGETSWTLKKGGTTIVSDVSNQTGDLNYDIYDGLFIKVFSPSPGIGDVDRSVGPDDGGPGGERWVSGTDWGAAWFFGSLDIGANFFGSELGPLDLFDMDIRFTSNPTMSVETGWSQGTVYRRDLGYVAETELGWMPMQAFDITDIDNPRQVNINFVEDASTGVANLLWNPIDENGNEYTFFMASDYNPGIYDDTNDGTETDVVYAMWPASRGRVYQLSDFWMRIIANRPNTPNDRFTFTAPAPQATPELEQASAENIGVFPNPYFGFNENEINRLFRFVTFNNLPPKATIRIFNLAGQLIRRIDKDNPGQFQQWDLLNHANVMVASGMYIAHIVTPDVGVTKILKLAIVQEAEILSTF